MKKNLLSLLASAATTACTTRLATAEYGSAGLPWEAPADRWARVVQSQAVVGTLIFLGCGLLAGGLFYFENALVARWATRAGIVVILLVGAIKVIF
jgi:hypothetical protein